jgi:hypothetical protein
MLLFRMWYRAFQRVLTTFMGSILEKFSGISLCHKTITNGTESMIFISCEAGR